MRTILVGLMLSLLSLKVFAVPECEVLRQLADQTNIENQIKNCEELMDADDDDVPNKRALAYAIKFMVENSKGLQHPDCALRGMDQREAYKWSTKEYKPQYKTPYWSKESAEKNVLKGIENTCSFVVNDIETRQKKKTLKSEAYYVNLCGGKPEVETFKVNLGTGPMGSDMPDTCNDKKCWNKSTLSGAFLLQGNLRDDPSQPFIPTRKEKYEHLMKKYAGKTHRGKSFNPPPTIDLIGLDSGSNTTEKILHIAPDYKTSFGCLGVSDSEKNFETFKKIVSQGTSLLINYVDKKSERRTGTCDNDDSDVGLYKDYKPIASTANTANTAKPRISKSNKSVFQQQIQLQQLETIKKNGNQK